MTTLFTPEDFAHNLGVIHSRIEAVDGDVHRIRVIAVSKGHPATSVAAALQAGQFDFGENYADELVTKAAEITALHSGLANEGLTKPVWHFQGRLQTNKINKLKQLVQWWHTVDSMDRASALASRIPHARVLVQLDATNGLGDRSGALLVDIPQIVLHAKAVGLEVVGLMTVAPLTDGQPDAAYRCFSQLSALADELGLPERSMGMSDDLEAAVRAGSTIVRIGSALFGPRR
jgi:PLP dependent protein